MSIKKRQPPQEKQDSLPRSAISSAEILPLFEFSTIVNSSLDLQFILNTLLLTTMGKLMVPKGMVLLRRSDDLFEVVSAKGVTSDILGDRLRIDDPPRRNMQIQSKRGRGSQWMTFLRQYHQTMIHPMISQQRIVGLVALGKKISGGPYENKDLELLESLSNISAASIEKANIIDELKAANREVDRKLQQLNTLFDLGKEFNLGLDDERVIRLLTFSLLGQVGAMRYVIFLRRDEELQPVAVRAEGLQELRLTLVQLGSLRKPTLVRDLAGDAQFEDVADALQRTGIEATIPMMVQNELRGLIMLGKKLNEEPYSQADLEFIYSLGNLAIISIENVRLFRETLDKQRLEDELKIAREIQQGLLPQVMPQIAGFEVAGVNVPSSQVGGDYYDVVKKSEKEFIVAIGDVSGKGTGAALLMSNLQASLRALAPLDSGLATITGRLNDLTSANTGLDKFITFFWGTLNTDTRVLHYVNAGHNLPFVIRCDGGIERLDKGGLILGVMKTLTPYEEGEVLLRNGDTLFLFTDGVSEAMNSEGEDFTEERLERLLVENQSLSIQELLEKVKCEIELHSRGALQSDDVTMLVLRCNK